MQKRAAPKDFTRVNLRIRVPEVRVIDADGTAVGVMDTRDARALADKQGLDLVEVSPTAKPPVCRVMDYGKFKYEQGKKQRQSRKSQVQVKLKEIKFHSNVGDHDYDTKMRHAREFLAEGHRIKFSLYFRGREGAHKDLGFDLMKRVEQDLGEQCQVDQTPRSMGRQIIMMISPAKKSKG